MIYFQKFIKSEDLKNNPDVIFVFGDNIEEWGLGGQAREMRGFKNAMGIPTKVSPKKFLDDSWFNSWNQLVIPKFNSLKVLNKNWLIVWPADGIGTGLADLKNKAPQIWGQLKKYEEGLGINGSHTT